MMGKYRIWGQSPFTFWCSIDPDRETLEFLVYECARKEAQREGGKQAIHLCRKQRATCALICLWVAWWWMGIWRLGFRVIGVELNGEVNEQTGATPLHREPCYFYP